MSTSTDELYGNRYRVVGLLGTGGMARVYRARDELLGREVALKVLSERLSSDRSFVERFRREAQNAARLNHPNIVALYDYGDEDSRYFIVMELIEGRSLSEVLDEDGALMPERAAEIARDTANGLGRAHEAGLVHRDIKPHNIMITNSGQTKVTDFGIARALGGDAEATMTQTGMVIGTAAYLSPEQAQGNPVDARSDVYSLGCVLHEALTGDTPFSGDTPLSIAYKHVRENPERASEVNSDVPEALDAIVMKAMSKNPDNRYADANEMAEDLDRFLAGHRVAATPFLAATSVMDAGSGTQVMSESEVYHDFPDEEEEERNTGKYVLITLLVLGLLALGAFLLSNLLAGAPEVDVPDVVGLTENRATRELEDAGLEVRTRNRSNAEVDEGDVFRQSPEAGATAEEGDTVTIFVSSGPGEVTVPNLLTLTEDQAEAALEDVGLELGRVRTRSSESAEGTVIEQNPGSGELLNEGEAVNIIISTGITMIAVPDVVGLPEADAVAAIEGEGLTADVVTEPSDDVEEGIVIAQDPGEGTELEEGDTVQILVSEGPEFEMPDVQGDDADDAEEFLEDELGLDVSQEGTEEPCPQEPGTVCSQDPEPGETVRPGDSVTLFVQEGDL
ncbi:MAG: Stk1 family PASTA domain-containing Ser/Thr kinase [Actinobacteria bacterium]|nr:Stk1 family PASTA domain-containing Ser/Thr kinase [Actinomycetota bacterium]